MDAWSIHLHVKARANGTQTAREDPISSRSMRLHLIPFASSTLLVLAACGPLSPAGLLDSTGDRAIVGDAGHVADATIPSSTEDGEAPEEDAAAIDATSDATNTGPLDATLPDAGKDASPPPKNGAVACGSTNGQTAYCTPGQACCIQSGPPGQGSVDGGAPTCALPNPAFCPGVLVACDDDSDCLGLACCGTLIDNNYTIVTCAVSCGPLGPTQSHLCNPNAAIDVCAAQGLTCVPSARLPGYWHCG